jgi:hypothetical protein
VETFNSYNQILTPKEQLCIFNMDSYIIFLYLILSPKLRCRVQLFRSFLINLIVEDQGDQRRGKAEEELRGVILLTDGLPQELDFEDQDDLWRGRRSGKAVGE